MTMEERWLGLLILIGLLWLGCRLWGCGVAWGLPRGRCPWRLGLVWQPPLSFRQRPCDGSTRQLACHAGDHGARPAPLLMSRNQLASPLVLMSDTTAVSDCRGGKWLT